MILKCKMCGGDIEITENKTIGLCLYCGCPMTFPKLDDDQKVAMFNRGNQYRRMGDFDRALSVYEKIIQEDNTDAEAHWCCALSRYGIEYVEDLSTYDWIPTCHRLSFDSFNNDIDYLAALEYSDGITKKQYLKDATRIVDIQRGILKTSQNEEPFDVFICYKETDASGERTVDSVLAQDIYYQLIDKGYRVFFSRVTLEDKIGTEFEPYIFAALNSAKVMLVIGTKKEYLDAVWVKNEWSRYLALMRKDREKVLLPCYKDMDPYDMPEALSILQSYDMTKIGFVQDLIRGIGKICNHRDKGDKGENIIVDGTMQSKSVEPLMKRILLFLEDSDFERADEYCENVLNSDPENSKAYLYKVMVSEKARREEELVRSGKRILNDSNFVKALRFANQEEKKRLEKLIGDIEASENDRAYSYACELSKSNDLEKACEACHVFIELDGFKDSAQRKDLLEKDIVMPQFEQAKAVYCNAGTVSELMKVLPTFQALSVCLPDAKLYLDKITEKTTNWRGVIRKLLERENEFKNAKELIDQIKAECPDIFESEEHKEFAKELDNYVYVEKLYGNAKNTVVTLCGRYCAKI